jgi:1,2-diacylglycerol 3-beta-galactosyltransferase
MKKRILFFMSDTGGGHRAAAQAIEEALHHLYPDTYDVLVEDIWRFHTPWPLNQIPQTYPWFTGPGLPLWKFMWHSSARLRAHRVVFPGLSPVLHRKVVRYLKSVQPNMVVSVHPFMNHFGVNWLHKAGLSIPLLTVVTDLVTLHPLWICPQVSHCIVPTEDARQFALEQGMPPEKLTVCGQPVGLKFVHANHDQAVAREKLNIIPDRQTILVLGGGEGFGPVYDIARTLSRSVPQAQLLIVAGRNKVLKQQLEAASWEIPTHVHGFVDNMPDFMAAADIVVTKAGPGTICEAFVMGLPPIISGYIPGQEDGNVAYVQQNNAGAYADTPEKIAAMVTDWLAPENSRLAELTQNAAALARPTASLDIAARISGMAQTGQPVVESRQPGFNPRRIYQRMRQETHSS